MPEEVSLAGDGYSGCQSHGLHSVAAWPWLWDFGETEFRNAKQEGGPGCSPHSSQEMWNKTDRQRELTCGLSNP